MKRATYRGVCVTLILGMFFGQGLAQIDQAVASSPLGIPDALGAGNELSVASTAGVDAPNFLALAKYAWSGKAPDGTVFPASASSAASTGTSYEASVHRALDVLVVLFPQEAANINNNREQLVASIVAGNKRAPPPLRNVKHASAPSSPNEVIAVSMLSPCLERVIGVIVDFAGVVMATVSFAGQPPAWAKVSNSFKGLLRTMGSNWIAGFKVLITNVRNAADISSKLVAVGKLVSEIFSQGGKLLLQAFKDNLSWWDWVKFGVSIVLAIGAFALSGGAWLTVKLVNIVYSNVALITSIVGTVTACA